MMHRCERRRVRLAVVVKIQFRENSLSGDVYRSITSSFTVLVSPAKGALSNYIGAQELRNQCIKEVDVDALRWLLASRCE